VRAIGALGDRRCVGPLVEAIADEPYVPARAEMARVLGGLGDRRAVRPLERLLAGETEQVVREAARAALARLRGGVAR
jgi:HEAT repeat protein